MSSEDKPDTDRYMKSLYRQVIETQQALGLVVAMAVDLYNLASLYVWQGRLAEAVPLLAQAEEIYERVGSPLAPRVREALAQVQAALAAEGAE